METVICGCGGRNFVPVSEHNEWLNGLHKRYTFTHVIHGNAKGADLFFEEWAKWNGIPYTRFTADWTVQGKQGGPLRNVQMAVHLKKCRENGANVYVLALPGGKGTEHMINCAMASSIEVIRYE